MHKILVSTSLIAGLALSGCAQVPLTYQPTMQNLETIKAANVAPTSLGVFAVAPDKAPAIDQSVSARSATVVSPINGSFAQYLKDALMQELRAAGKYDPASPVVISGLLTRNMLDAPMTTGSGALAARFTVTRSGTRVYEKELEEKAEWPSSFIGAEAIPRAINEYASLYKKLIGRLFGDAEFKAAVQAK